MKANPKRSAHMNFSDRPGVFFEDISFCNELRDQISRVAESDLFVIDQPVDKKVDRVVGDLPPELQKLYSYMRRIELEKGKKALESKNLPQPESRKKAKHDFYRFQRLYRTVCNLFWLEVHDKYDLWQIEDNEDSQIRNGYTVVICPPEGDEDMDFDD